jgi:hypothetical protein
MTNRREHIRAFAPFRASDCEEWMRGPPGVTLPLRRGRFGGLLAGAKLGLDLENRAPVLVLRDGHAAFDADPDSFLGRVVLSEQTVQQ